MKNHYTKLLLLFLLGLGTSTSFGQIIISQVYNGSGNSKCIEITNIGDAINLASPVQYKLGLWANAGTTGNASISGNPTAFINLTGTLEHGYKYVVSNGSFSVALPFDAVGSSNNTVAIFDGNDGLAIFIGTNTITDAFGTGINYENISYVRNEGVVTPKPNYVHSQWNTATISQVTTAAELDNKKLGTHYFGGYSITLAGSLASMTTTYGTASTPVSFAVTSKQYYYPRPVFPPAPLGLSPLFATVPVGFEASKQANFSSGVIAGGNTFQVDNGLDETTTVYLRLPANSTPGNKTGNILLSTQNTVEDVNLPTNAINTVNAKTLIITGLTANNKIYDGNTLTSLSGTAVLNDVLPADAANVVLGGTPVAQFDDAVTGYNKPVTVTGYTISGSKAGNYLLNQPIGLTANITSNNARLNNLALSGMAISPVFNPTLNDYTAAISLAVTTTSVTYTVGETNQSVTAQINGGGYGSNLNFNLASGLNTIQIKVISQDATTTNIYTINITQGTNWYQDLDGDGFGNAAISIVAAVQPSDYVADATDCNDNLATVNSNASEVLGNGIDDNCDGTTDEVTPLSSLIASSCGATLTNLSNTLFAYPLSNFLTQTGPIQGYRFRVTNGAQVRTFDSSTNSFALTSLPGGAAYATTYTVEVSVKHGGYYRAYGPACSVTTPLVPNSTNIASPACGSILTDINNTIFATQVPSASGYRFRVRNGSTIVGTVDTSVSRFSLASIAGIQFGTTYTIDVLLAFNNVYRPDAEYGPVCSISTPATPGTSRVIQPTCGGSISTFWTTIFAQQVSGAQGYKFVVTNGAQTREYATPNPRFALANLPGGAAANTAYTIRVDVLYNASYVQGTQLCTLTTTPGASRQTDAALSIYEVSAYPNPYADTFKLNVNTSSENQIGVKVYDMLGREVESRQDSVDAITNLEIGSRYPSGVYNIIVTQGDNVKTLRVIKR